MKKLYAILALSIFGLANAAYLTISAFNYQGGDTSELFCDINETFSCSSLFGFDFAWIFGIPFPAIALGVYPILAIIALLGITKKIKSHYYILALLSLGGIMFNGYIIYNEFQVNVFCPACLACTVAIVTIAILSFVGIKQQKS